MACFSPFQGLDLAIIPRAYSRSRGVSADPRSTVMIFAPAPARTFLPEGNLIRTPNIYIRHTDFPDRTAFRPNRHSCLNDCPWRLPCVRTYARSVFKSNWIA